MKQLPKIKKTCENCGKEFEVPPYRNDLKNCSRSCGIQRQAAKMRGNNFGFQNGHKINESRWQDEITREKISASMKEQYSSGKRKPTRDELHGMWKGNDAGYMAVHVWVRKNKKKPTLCEHCGLKKPVDVANISGKYLRDVEDYLYLCRRCHMIQDGRLSQAL